MQADRDNKSLHWFHKRTCSLSVFFRTHANPLKCQPSTYLELISFVAVITVKNVYVRKTHCMTLDYMYNCTAGRNKSAHIHACSSCVYVRTYVGRQGTFRSNRIQNYSRSNCVIFQNGQQIRVYRIVTKTKEAAAGTALPKSKVQLLGTNFFKSCGWWRLRVSQSRIRWRFPIDLELNILPRNMGHVMQELYR
jgi:hypothetical protein